MIGEHHPRTRVEKVPGADGHNLVFRREIFSRRLSPGGRSCECRNCGDEYSTEIQLPLHGILPLVSSVIVGTGQAFYKKFVGTALFRKSSFEAK